MPEGPEVQITVDWLDKHYSGKTLLSVEILSAKFLKQSLNLPLCLKEVIAYGKRIFFNFGTQFLIFSLGMTGRFTTTSLFSVKLIFDFSGTKLYYNDARGFGFGIVESDASQWITNNLGNDPLREEIDDWSQVLYKNRNRQLVVMLLDQKSIAGVGNYLKSEILYAAKLKPDRLVSSLSKDESNLLLECIYDKIRTSYQHGGLTIKDFWSPDGNRGVFPISVYSKKHDPLNNIVVRDTFKDNRTTYWVPEIQK